MFSTIWSQPRAFIYLWKVHFVLPALEASSWTLPVCTYVGLPISTCACLSAFLRLLRKKGSDRPWCKITSPRRESSRERGNGIKPWHLTMSCVLVRRDQWNVTALCKPWGMANVCFFFFAFSWTNVPLTAPSTHPPTQPALTSPPTIISNSPSVLLTNHKPVSIATS